ncbi:fungal-specific transcription factor domain-containing protein [Fusarium sp. MPI-SDFR-AT-0072]|nr:fungal-specific transcription factor domain-containing protein [Fusarium sp. MPI-SDFR-AT-0072]
MATNSNSSQNTSDDNLPQKEFAFVQNESNKRELRSHAMREHWKNRRQTINEEKQKKQKRTQHTLLPTPKTQSTMSDENSESSNSVFNTNASSDTALIPNNERQSDLEGIPYQILSGVNLALGSSRIDPFDQLPLKLSVLHHKLLHHWFSAHAAMMFGPSPDGAFSPMRDVWLPLDLSNPASFNALMALSAAHLSRMQGFSQSEVALEFKSEAVRIVQLWMQDPERAVSDDVLASILRLLSYERYWGTEAEWIIHHRGLMNLVEVRGGIAALSSNWRLELTTFLVSLMARPTWFDCSNQIQELLTHTSELPLHPVLSNVNNLRKVRSLWLLSFIQDMGTFRTNLLGTSTAHYSAVHEAILLLKAHRQDNELDSGRPELCSDLEFIRLATLLFICVVLQKSPFESLHDTRTYGEGGWSFQMLDNLDFLSFFLEANKPSWHGSLENLNSILFSHFTASEGTGLDPDYVRNITTVVASLTGGVRDAVERCLLEILCQASGGEQNLFEEKFTPDILLSTIPR